MKIRVLLETRHRNRSSKEEALVCYPKRACFNIPMITWLYCGSLYFSFVACFVFTIQPVGRMKWPV